MKKAISTRGNATIGVKIVITGWNFQKSQNDQSDDALRCAYCLMFSTAYHTKEGANVNPLSRFLLPSASNIIFGFTTFSLRVEPQRTVLRVSAPMGECVPTIPTWLQIPLVEAVPTVNTTYTPEVGAPTFDRIRLRDNITDHNGPESNYGSLGAIILERTEDGDEPYGITAGHVLAGREKFHVTHRITQECIKGTRMPLKTPDSKDRISAEVGILKLKTSDADKFCPIMDDDTVEPPFSSEAIGYKALWDTLDREKIIYVHKDGVSSGLTIARLGDLQWDFPEYKKKTRTPRRTDIEGGFDEEFDESLLKEYKELAQPEMHRWVGIVDWFEEGCPFAVPGDSGALIYTTENSVVVPLGIHIGSPHEEHSEQTSMFLSLDSWFIEARLLGAATGVRSGGGQGEEE